MAASSAKDKAHALKDSYVAGLIEGGATAPAPAMPSQDMGEQASIMIRPGRTEFHDDGDPGVYMSTASSGAYNMKQLGQFPDAANPGFRGQNLTPGQAKAVMMDGKRNAFGGYSQDKTPGGLMKKQRAFNEVYPNNFERIHVY